MIGQAAQALRPAAIVHGVLQTAHRTRHPLRIRPARLQREPEIVDHFATAAAAVATAAAAAATLRRHR
jgi:hypothetical protein